MIHVLAIITAKPGMREAVLKEFRANMPAVRAEQGCVEYGPAIDTAGSPAKFGDDAFVVIE
jgi:quinol monooxygenase YgiN